MILALIGFCISKAYYLSDNWLQDLNIYSLLKKEYKIVSMYFGKIKQTNILSFFDNNLV